MRYSDGNEVKAGDVVQIDTTYSGTVIACMETNDYLPGEEDWAYLKEGIMVNTDFGGLVHYVSGSVDELRLIHRASKL
jgi:hypothetical protein